MKHIHAELMAQYAQDAMETDKPWERWEYKNAVMHDWYDCGYPINWIVCVQYRRKQKPYEPTLLDQALELEIEAAKLRMKSYAPSSSNLGIANWEWHVKNLESRREPAMIEHLKQKGKP